MSSRHTRSIKPNPLLSSRIIIPFIALALLTFENFSHVTVPISFNPRARALPQRSPHNSFSSDRSRSVHSFRDKTRVDPSRLVNDPVIANCDESCENNKDSKDIDSSQVPKKIQSSHKTASGRLRNRCLLYGSNPQGPLWQFNSRTLCTFSRACLRIREGGKGEIDELHIPNGGVECGIAETENLGMASSDRVDELERGCNGLRERALSVYGKGNNMGRPQFLRVVEGVPEVEGDEEGVVVVVPRYPFMMNIYHFLNVVTGVAHVMRDIGGVSRVVIMGREIGRAWQREVIRVMVGGKVKVEWLGSSGGCWREVVMMGRRKHVNLWPFMNSSQLELDGRSVALGAVEFKRRFYEEFGIESRLPVRGEGMSELPPLVVGYSRRLGVIGSIGKKVHEGGTRRTFQDEDENWFVEMLKEESKKAGTNLKIFTITGDESLEEQVRTFAGVGLLVGIHGANLLNGVFMHPFGGLLEVFANGAKSPCYMAGANSGLAYASWETTLRASMEESGCVDSDRECRHNLRRRLVKIGTEEDRIAIRSRLRGGINRLVRLHDMFPDGIPVFYDELAAKYYTKYPG